MTRNELLLCFLKGIVIGLAIMAVPLFFHGWSAGRIDLLNNGMEGSGGRKYRVSLVEIKPVCPQCGCCGEGALAPVPEVKR